MQCCSGNCPNPNRLALIGDALGNPAAQRFTEELGLTQEALMDALVATLYLGVRKDEAANPHGYGCGWTIPKYGAPISVNLYPGGGKVAESTPWALLDLLYPPPASSWASDGYRRENVGCRVFDDDSLLALAYFLATNSVCRTLCIFDLPLDGGATAQVQRAQPLVQALRWNTTLTELVCVVCDVQRPSLRSLTPARTSQHQFCALRARVGGHRTILLERRSTPRCAW